MDNPIKRSEILTPLIERKIKLESTLRYMKRKVNTFHFEDFYYNIAIECIEKELENLNKEIDSV